MNTLVQKIPTLKDMLDALREDVKLSSPEELRDACNLIIQVQAFDSGERDCIIASFKRGPLGDGDVHSKSSRNKLVENGFMAKVIVNGEDGYNACTYRGASAYRLISIGA